MQYQSEIDITTRLIYKSNQSSEFTVEIKDKMNLSYVIFKNNQVIYEQNENDLKNTKNAVRRELANFLGVETEDIEDDVSLTEDLHMKATDLTDFLEVLTRMGMETSNVDLTETETFLDLVETLTDHQ